MNDYLQNSSNQKKQSGLNRSTEGQGSQHSGKYLQDNRKNPTVQRKLRGIDSNQVIQLAKWRWNGKVWVNLDGTGGSPPPMPGKNVGDIKNTDDSKPLISLNLGAGQNPKPGLGVINLEYSKEDALAGKKKKPGAQYVIADANNLPFRDGVFDQVDAVNPYGFNPVNSETARVMDPVGKLKVTGNDKNKYAKNSGSTMVVPEDVRLKQTGIQGMTPEHQFGQQSHTGGSSSLDTSTSKTRVYEKGRITISEAAKSINPQLKRYYELWSKLELKKLSEREEGYQDEYALDSEYLSTDESAEYAQLKSRFGRLVSG